MSEHEGEWNAWRLKFCASHRVRDFIPRVIVENSLKVILDELIRYKQMLAELVKIRTSKAVDRFLVTPSFTNSTRVPPVLNSLDHVCCSSGKFDVSFEAEGMHGWKLCESHEEKKKPNWYFSRGITPSPNTGPKQDHTSGSGTFLGVLESRSWFSDAVDFSFRRHGDSSDRSLKTLSVLCFVHFTFFT